MMLIVRFGLLIWLFVRLIFVVEKLRTKLTGTPVTIGQTPIVYKILRNKKKVTGIRFGIVVPNTLCFLIRKERYFDRVAKTLGIAAEFQTGDRDFDRRAYILSDDRTLLTALAVDKPLRQGISQLMNTGTSNVVRCNGGRLWIECPAKALSSKTLDDHTIVQLLGGEAALKLATVRERLSSIHANDWSGERDPYIARAWFFYAVSAAVGALAIVSFFWSARLGFPRSLLFDNAERLAVTSAAIGVLTFIAAAVLALRGTSRLHLVLLEIVLTVSPAAWYVSRTWYAEQNIRQDRSAVREEAIRVVERHIRTGRRRSRSYYITLEKWPDPRIERQMKVYASEYSLAVPGRCVRVAYHSGRYGDPWIDSFEPLENCGNSW
jgi:hypothetical protein